MKIFLDTSSLFKLYHKEEQTEALERLFVTKNITTVFLSEITKIEFLSTIWKKVRTKEISQTDAELFESDFEKFTFIEKTAEIIDISRNLLSKYGVHGLRTLDSIQFASAMFLSKKASLFITSDNLLETFFEIEGLPII